jgi:oligopeptide transport system substrate-binding protein
MRQLLILASCIALLDCSKPITPPTEPATKEVVTASAPVTKENKRYIFQKPRQTKGQTLVFHNGFTPQTIDPGLATGSSDGRIIIQLFEGLLEYDPKTLAPLPAIAESFEANSTQDRFTFRLRKNARWSNGDPVTAHDFVYSWERVLHPVTGAQYSIILFFIENAEEYLNESVRVLTKPIKIGGKEFAAGEPVRILSASPKGEENTLPSSNRYKFALATTIRTGPSDSSPALEAVDSNTLQSFNAGDIVYVLRREGDWAKVSDANRVGYVPMKSLSLIAAKTTLTIEALSQPGVSATVKIEDVTLDPKILGFRAVDDFTLEVKLKNPTPYFPELLAHYTYRPVHQKTVERYGIFWTYQKNIVTNGAFLLDNLNQYRFILTKNPTYWDAANVKLEKIIASNNEDLQKSLKDYEDGKVDLVVANDLPIERLSAIKGAADYYVEQSNGTYFYRLNTTKAPFDNAKVRQALSLAINREKLIQSIEIPVLPASTITPPALAGFTPPQKSTFDPKRAKELLAEAGYSSAKPFPEISIMFNMQVQHLRIAENIQQQWRESLGITAKLENKEWIEYLNSTQSLEYEVTRAGWIGDYPEPATFLDMWSTGNGNNNTGWSNKEYDAMIKQAAQEPNQEKRNEIYTRQEKMLAEEMPFIPLYYYVWFGLVRPEVQGFYPNLQDQHPLKFVSLQE